MTEYCYYTASGEKINLEILRNCLNFQCEALDGAERLLASLAGSNDIETVHRAVQLISAGLRQLKTDMTALKPSDIGSHRTDDMDFTPCGSDTSAESRW